MAKISKRGRKAPPQARRDPVAAVAGSGERFELAMRAINEGVYDWDVASGAIYYSEAVYSVLHMPRSVKTPAGWRKRIHPEDLAAYDAAIVAHFKKKTRRFECDYRYQARDRSWRWARQHGIAQRDARGRVVRIVGSTGDITELKRVELALAESRERYALATWAATEGIYEWNLVTGTLFLSDRAKAFFGVKGAKLTPAAWNARIHRDDFAGYRAALAAYFKGRTRQFEHEYRIRGTKGGYAWVVDRAAAVRDASRKVVRLVGALADVTQRKLAEIELRRARDNATEALERQTATAEILRVMASSPSDVQPVVDAIAAGATRLCDASFCIVFRYDGVQITVAADDGRAPGTLDVIRAAYPAPPRKQSIAARAILERRVISIADAQNMRGHAQQAKRARAIGYRSILAVPMMKGGAAIGSINVARLEVNPFTDEQIDLLKTFADQAVIAIENVRLFNETKEALERQTATAEILKVIASSPTDTQPVFDAIASSALRIFDGTSVAVFLERDGKIDVGAVSGHTDKMAQGLRKQFPRPLGRDTASGRTILDRTVQHFPDVAAPDVPAGVKAVSDETRARAILAAPMLREGTAIGAIVLTRNYAGPFSDKLIALLQTFADQAVIAIQNVRLFNELESRNRDVTDALERQTATAEILRVIASSPDDTQPVFDAIAESAKRLIGARGATVTRAAGDRLQLVAFTSSSDEGNEALKRLFSNPLPPSNSHMIVVRTGKPVLRGDIENNPDVSPEGKEVARTRGYQSQLTVPMLRDGVSIGTIAVTRREAGPFSDHQISLLETFADQAVIAIQNVQQFNETKEALERQTATAEILKVIASSPDDVQPVFDAIAQSAKRLFNGRAAVVTRVTAETIHLAAYTATDKASENLLKSLYPQPVATSDSTHAQVARSGEPVYIVDKQNDSEVSPGGKALARARGYRSQITVPMLREGAAVGTISVVRVEAGAFTDHQINLLKTFADQAVIAIENVRLFNETKEALERQTATAEILKVIASSPSNVQPVLDAIVSSAARLFEPCNANIIMRDGNRLPRLAIAGPRAQGFDLQKLDKEFPIAMDTADSPTAMAILESRTIEIPDTGAGDVSDRVRAFGRITQAASMVIVPLLRGGSGIGAIVLTTQQRGFKLEERQLALMKTFADQAVIAIENVRLFNETREALDRQTATAEILKVISSSPTDMQPVFEVILENATRLCDAHLGLLGLYDGEKYQTVAQRGANAEFGTWILGRGPFKPVPDGGIAEMIAERRPAQIADYMEVSPYRERHASAVKLVEVGRVRTYLSVPMLKEGRVVGGISIYRPEVRPFTQKQVDLVSTFASQAVIAIENVRLFNETKEALERQTATAEILKVISSSPTDTQPVFEAIAQSVVRLCDGLYTYLGLFDGKMIDFVAFHNVSPRALTIIRERFPSAPDQASSTGRAILDRAAIHIPDVMADAEYSFRDLARADGYRAILAVPMLREGNPIGVIAVGRRSPFSGDQIELVKTFADQAVIAIENVRLFKELQAQTAALTRSVGQLTALGEVGQAISSSLDLETVLQTIVSRAVQLTGVDAGSIYEYDEREEVYRLQAAEKMAPELVEAVRRAPIRKGDGATGRTAETLEPVQVPDIQDESYHGSRKDNLMRTGYRAVLAVPLLRENHLLGALQVFRKAPGAFAPEIVELLKTFATQSAMAIQNARLFREIAEKGKQLEQASQHKSNFLASMSHELRTPLNAILGFNEMIIGQVYGEVPSDMQEPLADIQTSGKHLLRLINNVLDLAKIEAGRMELSLQDYSVHDTVGSVHSTLRPLAADKGLEFLATVPEDLPLAYGDGGRIAQCLMNLAGNSIKFTRAGKVEISVAEKDGLLTYRVSDTGIGIPPDKIDSLFTEFKQTDATIASEYGGTGLGLSISKKFVEMHGGRIWIESELGKGSAFIFEIPLRMLARD